MTEGGTASDAGQGAGGSGGLFDSYLQDVPEDGREVVSQYLADAARHVNSRLEQAAEIDKTLGQYREVEALNQYRPEDLKQLLDWHQEVTGSPDSYIAWLSDAAKAAGLTPQEQQQLADAATELTPDEVRALVSEATQTSVTPLQEQMTEFMTQQFVEREAKLVDERFAAIESEHNIQLTEDQKAAIVALGIDAMPDDNANLVGGQDWIGAGYDRFQKITSNAQAGFVDDKLKQPDPAMGSGGVGQVELPKTWAEAAERAKEKLRQSRT